MRRILPGVVLIGLLGGCAVYPDGRIGPLPPAGAYVPPPVTYAPPAYAYPGQPGVPVYVAPVAPPPVVVTPSIGIGIGLGWGRGAWWPRGYWGRPYRRW